MIRTVFNASANFQIILKMSFFSLTFVCIVGLLPIVVAVTCNGSSQETAVSFVQLNSAVIVPITNDIDGQIESEPVEVEPAEVKPAEVEPAEAKPRKKSQEKTVLSFRRSSSKLGLSPGRKSTLSAIDVQTKLEDAEKARHKLRYRITMTTFIAGGLPGTLCATIVALLHVGKLSEDTFGDDLYWSSVLYPCGNYS